MKMLLAFGNWNIPDNRSCHPGVSRRNDFPSHRKARAQGTHVSRMSLVLIVSKQIGKGLFAFLIRAYVSNNPFRRRRIVSNTIDVAM